MKKLLIYGACLLLSMGAVSCHGDDPLANNTVLPVVPATPNSLSGVVTDINGNPVAGAKVTLDDGRTTTTDENGFYEFEDVSAGKHTITVEKDGMFSSTRDIDVSGSEKNLDYVEGFTMNRRNTKTVKIIPGQAAETDVTSDAIPGNEKGKVEITADVPEDAIVNADGTPVTDELEIYVTPIYTEETAQVMETKAVSDEHDMLIGATVHCSKEGVVLKKPIALTFNLDDSALNSVYTEVYDAASDKWSSVNSTKENGKIVIAATDFTSYGVFIDMTVTTADARENLTFKPSVWDNFNGNGNLYVDFSSYVYHSGANITTKAANALEGLLIEHLARKVGNKVDTINGRYNIEQSISVGAGLRIWGYQDKINWTLADKATNKNVKAVSYSTVHVFTEGWLGDHNGGGSSNN